jgi:hypothetical protein
MRQIPGKYHPVTLLNHSGSDNKDFWSTDLDVKFGQEKSMSRIYWILQAFGHAYRMEHALASIKSCWAAPMALGKGCFWEQSSPDWVNFMNDGDVAYYSFLPKNVLFFAIPKNLRGDT